VGAFPGHGDTNAAMPVMSLFCALDGLYNKQMKQTNKRTY
jgi:hypothetical protein